MHIYYITYACILYNEVHIYVVYRLHREMAVDYLQGLARTVYIHTVYDRIFGDFPAKKQKWRVYTVYIWSWPTLIIYNLSQGLVTIAKKLGPHDCPEKNKKGRKYKLKLRRKCSCEDRVTEKMEKLERSTDKNQE